MNKLLMAAVVVVVLYLIYLHTKTSQALSNVAATVANPANGRGFVNATDGSTTTSQAINTSLVNVANPIARNTGGGYMPIAVQSAPNGAPPTTQATIPVYNNFATFNT